MTARGKGTRHAALRRAKEIRMARDAALLQRERQIEQALADYFLHTNDAEVIRRQAQERAAKLLADAETASREPEAFAAIAVRVLAQLGETRASISELTGLSPAQLREVLAQPTQDD